MLHILKLISLSCTFSKSTISNNMHCSFGKHWFTELYQSFKCWLISPYNLKKSHSLISALITSENSKHWEAVKLKLSKKYNFSRILIFIWVFKFYHWQHILWVVFPEVAVSLCPFIEKMPIKCSGLSNHSLAVCSFK